MKLNPLTDDGNAYQIIKFLMDRHGSARYSDLRSLTSDPLNMNPGTFHKKLEELMGKGIIERNGSEKYTRPRIYQLSSKTLQIMDPCYSHFHKVLKECMVKKEEIIKSGKDDASFSFISLQREIKRIFETMLLITIFNGAQNKKIKNKFINEVSLDNGLEFILKLILNEVSIFYNKLPIPLLTEEELKQFSNSFEGDEEWVKETVKIYLSNYFSSPPP